MGARDITVKHERRDLAHVTVRTWSDDAGDMADVYVGSIDRGEWHTAGCPSITDEERAIAMKFYNAGA